MKHILILGKLPPPVGGITNHVHRLIRTLPEKGFNQFHFTDLRLSKWATIFNQIAVHRIIHLHISNPFAQLLFALVCKIFGKKLLITYHGNWGRYSWFKNLAVALSAWLSEIPIVQNQESRECATRWNRNAALISTHIPEQQCMEVNQTLESKLSLLATQYKYLFCTNAWNLTFHKNGKETYGISELAARMKDFPESALIISDPSGNYERYLLEKPEVVPHNVTFITYPHDFRQVLQASTAFIRNTETDGVSLSIHEALELGKPVFASNVVSRPQGCFVFENVMEVDFVGLLKEAETLMRENQPRTRENPVDQIIALYLACQHFE